MSHPYDTQVLGAEVELHHQPLRKPLQISSGAITETTEARVRVRVRAGGREAEGAGSIYLSDLWAWPDAAIAHERRDQILREMCQRIAADLPALCGGEAAHPLELGLRLHHSVCGPLSPDDPPVLAAAMCLSPFDAAIHDAAGQALGVSAFAFYDQDVALPSADTLFPGGAAAAIRRMLAGKPRTEFPAWLIVSRGDSLEKDVRPWVADRGYWCFKVKILGRDNEDDARRTAEVYQAVRRFGAARLRLSVDSNEANPDAASVLDFLQRLRAIDSEAFDALEYLEQPTARDIRRCPNNWRGVTALKPVLLDEGLTDFGVLPEAKAQGWSGLALKTCKGQSFALVAAAWAKVNGLQLSLQDLTNPGYSLIHAALFAAYVPTLNGVELNSPQYTPTANAPWLPRLAALFEPRDGMHRLAAPDTLGLGSRL